MLVVCVSTYKKKTCFGVATPFSTGPWSFDAIVLVVNLEMYAGKGLVEASALLVVRVKGEADNCLFAQTGLPRAVTGCLMLKLEGMA